MSQNQANRTSLERASLSAVMSGVEGSVSMLHDSIAISQHDGTLPDSVKFPDDQNIAPTFSLATSFKTPGLEVSSRNLDCLSTHLRFNAGIYIRGTHKCWDEICIPILRILIQIRRSPVKWRNHFTVGNAATCITEQQIISTESTAPLAAGGIDYGKWAFWVTQFCWLY